MALQEATKNGGSNRAPPKTARDNPLAAVAAAATAAVAAPAVARGLKLTTAFLASLRTSKRHGRIDGYNDLHNKEEADDRNDQYADLVDSYYDLATEFYEWGWGACFHFADRRGRKTFAQSLLRHEYYLASRLALKAGDCVLDCGCGIGGPARNIARFTRASHARHHDQPVPGGSRMRSASRRA